MIFNYNKVYNYQFVSVVIPSTTSTRIYFPDLPNLRDVYTVGISMYSSTVISQDPSGLTISAFSGNNTFVTLVENNIERFQQLEGACLSSLGGGVSSWANSDGSLSIKPTKFDYSKSYIQFTASFGLVANTVIPFGIYYLYPHEYKALQQQQQ